MEFFLAIGAEGVPLSDDFGNDFRLSHFGELVLVLVVLLATELPVDLVQYFVAFLFAHQYYNPP